MSVFRCVVAAAALMTGFSACAPDVPSDVDTSRPSEFGFQTSVQTSLEEEGRVAYERYCVGCHGVEGDGKGPAAGFLHPPPRNFQKANFKFSSTRSGRLPTDADLERTITEGLRGSAMPGWDLVGVRTVKALVAYIKTFSTEWEKAGRASPIPVVNDPYRGDEDTSRAVQRGELIYHGFATCWTCHPAYVSKQKINEYLKAMENPTRERFRDNLFEAEVKPNDEGELIYPPDFHRDFVRSGADVGDLYRSIAAGITGTAMPTWVDSMEYPKSSGEGPLVQTSDIWALAYYVQSLILSRPTKLQEDEVVVRKRPQKIYLEGEVPAAPPHEAAPQETTQEFEEEFQEEFQEDGN